MAQKDYIAPAKTIERKTTINITDLIKDLHTMIKDRGYPVILEQNHKEATDDKGNKSIFFYWMSPKKVSDYVKIILEVMMSATVKNISIEKNGKKQTVQEGTISFKITGYILKDIEDEWKFGPKGPLKKFFREVVDKFIKKDNMSHYENELNGDLKKIIHELKTYLKMYRLD